VLVAGAVFFLAAGYASSFGQQAAPGRDPLKPVPSRVDVASMKGKPGQSIPVKISVAGAAINREGLVMIQGVPDGFRFSRGISSGNAWLLSSSELPNLLLIVPTNFQGRFDIKVIFVQGEGQQKQTRTASVNIQPERPPGKPLAVPMEGTVTETAAVIGAVLPGSAARERKPPVRSVIPMPVRKPVRLSSAKAQEPPSQAYAPSTPKSDGDINASKVAEYCFSQRQICRKVCYLRFRDDVFGCSETCDSRVSRCNKSGCYKWIEPELIIAERFGASRCIL
jgi:hypothetical protein